MSIRKEIVGSCTLYHGDMRDVLPLIEAEGVKFDSIATDPPYSSGGMTRGDRMASTRVKYQRSDVEVEHPEFTGDSRDQRAWTAWVADWMGHLAALCVPGGIASVFADWRQLPSLTDAIQMGGWVWRGILPWDKVNGRPVAGRYRSQCEFVVWATNGPRDATPGDDSEYHPGILRGMAPVGKARIHSTQKPVGVMEAIVRTAPAGGVVFDPFAGSGSTAVACINTDRRFVGVEKDPHIFDLALARITQAVAARPALF